MTSSHDGRWSISQITEGVITSFMNREYSCQHSIAPFELEPGEEITIWQNLYFVRGIPADLVKRWRRDFDEDGRLWEPE